MLSAGADADAQLHDIRQPKAVLHTLRGHARVAAGRRQYGIHQPTFCGGGSAVCIMGDNSNLLSVYSAETGLALSRGQVDWDWKDRQGTTIGLVPPSDGQPHEVMLVAHQEFVSPFQPVYA